ncbi:TPA: fimbrial biogenesis outer membrane usher protein [Escherichia coli]|nr:fimbrial biogenesis outer membrane usher protein [Escherichia coli]
MRKYYSQKLSILILGISPNVIAGDYFDPSMLENDVGNYEDFDISVFSNPGGGIEGEREVSIYVNDTFYERSSLRFKNNGSTGVLEPEFPSDFFERILISEYNSFVNENIVSTENLLKAIPYSEVKFDEGNSRLDISIPQANLKGTTQLKSMPDKWDHGIPAIIADYQLSGAANKNEYASSYNLFYSSNLGFNFNEWRFRTLLNYSYYSSDLKYGKKIKNDSLNFYNSYVERDIVFLRSTLRAGELSTQGKILDSFNYIGGSIYNNDEMLNDNLRRYTPTIRGIANSQAVVTVKQKDRIVLQENVPAGPFELKDFSLTGYSGDLLVHIKESDGQEHSFIQPFSTLPEMKREGVSDYSFSFGRYDNRGAEEYYQDNAFISASWSRGFGDGITLFGETLYSNGYNSLGMGSTFSLGEFGAISGDVSISRTKKNTDMHIGQSYGFKYSKNKIDTGTTLTLATYRYSTEDFYTFSDYVSKQDSIYNIWSNKLKNRVSLSLNQSLGEYGSLSLTASRQSYWSTAQINESMSLAHNFGFNGVYISTSFSLDQVSRLGSYQGNNKTFGIYASIPVGALLGSNNRSHSSLSYNMTKNKDSINNNMTLTGSIPDTKVGYRVSRGWGNNGVSSSNGLSLNWNGDYINSTLGYTWSGNVKNVDYSLSGSAVVYPWGIAMGPGSIINGAAIVDTQGVSGVKLRQGGKTSFLGTALVSSLLPYSENRVDLDPQDLPDDVVIGSLSKSFIPSKGAVIHLKYNVFKGKQVIFNLKKADGSSLPFGSIVSIIGRDDNTGIVDDDGKVYLAGVPEQGTLRASYGKNKTCDLSFNMNNKSDKRTIIEYEGVCK